MTKKRPTKADKAAAKALAILESIADDNKAAPTARVAACKAWLAALAEAAAPGPMRAVDGVSDAIDEAREWRKLVGPRGSKR